MIRGRRFAAPFRTAVVAAAALVAATVAIAQTVRRGAITFVHEAESTALAESLAALPGLLTLPALPPDILERRPDITVRIAADEVEFRSITGGQAPEWGAGVAYPDSGLIVLPGYDSRRGAVHQLGRVLRHELAHVGLQRYLGPLQVPRWFTEGYSTWTAGQLDVNAGWLLRLAFVTGRAPPLDSLTLDWPARTTDAQVAYLLSASVIEYLHANGGDRALRLFLQRWQEDGRFERAIFDTWGLSLGQLERYWSRDVRRRYGWLQFAAQSVVIWSLTGGLVAVLFFIRRKRDRGRLERMRANELPDDPEFWVHTGQPDSGQPGQFGMNRDVAPWQPRPISEVDESDGARGDDQPAR